MSVNENNAGGFRSESPKSFGGKKSLLTLGVSLGAALSRNANGAALEGFAKVMGEVIAAADKSLKLELFPLDNQATGLIYSILLIKGEYNGHAATYEYIISASAEPRAPKIYKENNREVEIPVVPGDIYNAELVAKIRELMQPRLTGRELTDVGACVLPADFDYESVDAVRKVVHTGVSAIADFLRGVAGQDEYFNAADYASASFRGRLVFNGGDVNDALGQPLRTNFRLTLTGSEQNNRSEILQSDTQLASSSGFINLRYVGQQQMPGPMGHPVLTSQRMIPVVNVTSTVVEQDVLSPELHLVALAMNCILGRNEAWRHVFRPTKGDDFSAILANLDGLSTDVEQPIKSKDASFDLNMFLNTFVFPTPVYRMDIEECGAQTWLNEMIREACRGNGEAYNMVIATANRMTNNAFSSLFAAGEPIGMLENDRTILGVYRDRNGRKRDLREIDKLALDNMNPDDPTVGIEYERTLDGNYASMPIRIAERVALLRRQLADQLTITGFATPVILNPKFLMALFLGMEKAGLQVRLDSAYDTQQVWERNFSQLVQFGMQTGQLAAQQPNYNAGGYNYSPYSHFASGGFR